MQTTMPPPTSTAPHERTAPVTDALIGTLHEEADALDTLNALLGRQLEAVRAGTPEALADITTQMHTCTAALEALQQTRARQTRLLGRVLEVDEENASLPAIIQTLRAHPADQVGTRLTEARAVARKRAQTARQRSEALRFTLGYAAGLNRDLLLAMQGVGPAPGRHTYTAGGRTEAARDARSFVNAIG